MMMMLMIELGGGVNFHHVIFTTHSPVVAAVKQ
jgi:hypothetical protein